MGGEDLLRNERISAMLLLDAEDDDDQRLQWKLEQSRCSTFCTHFISAFMSTILFQPLPPR